MSAFDWAVAAYQRDGVEAALLDLQDRYEQSVPLLLFAAWAAAEGRPLDADTLEAAVDTARAYETAAIGALRALRRALKTPIPDVEDHDRLAMRERVTAAELEGERRLIVALGALAPQASGPPRPSLDAMVAAARAWGRITPRAELASLAARL